MSTARLEHLHNCVVALIKGEIPDPYKQVLLEGKSSKTSTLTYYYIALLAKNGNPAVAYVPVEEGQPSAEQVARRIQKYKLNDDQVGLRTMATSTNLIPDLRLAAVTRANELVGDSGLPLAFIGFFQAHDDGGKERAIFFYPSGAPGDVLLDGLKEAARQGLT